MNTYRSFPYLWDRPVVPNVTFMGKDVGNVSELAFLYILFDWIQRFLCCNLEIAYIYVCARFYLKLKKSLNLPGKTEKKPKCILCQHTKLQGYCARHKILILLFP